MNISKELFTTSLGDVIDGSRSALFETSTEYQEAEREFLSSERVYLNLELPQDVREAIDYMMEKKDTQNNIAADLSYIAGALDAVKLLKALGVIDGKPVDLKIDNL